MPWVVSRHCHDSKMTIFRTFRDFLETLKGIRGELAFLGAEITRLCDVQRELGPAIDRLEALELSRAHHEAEMQGLVLKAEGQYRAAFNAEARERTIKKSNERFTDPLDEPGETETPSEGVYILKDDATPGEAEGVPPVRLALAPVDGKAAALARKWGR